MTQKDIAILLNEKCWFRPVNEPYIIRQIHQDIPLFSQQPVFLICDIFLQVTKKQPFELLHGGIEWPYSTILNNSGSGTGLFQDPLLLTWFNFNYSIHVPGWLLKWLNLITTHGSVSNEPISVTWLATKYLKTVNWRNHTEKWTTL